MHSVDIRSRRLVALALVALSGQALATNGYLSHGYGNQSKGAVGVAAALPQDALVTATNPAGLMFLDNRLDLGVDIFVPRREAEISGNMFPGVDDRYDGNDSKTFYIPEFGYRRALSDDVAFGLAIYGNGGINTDYLDNPYGGFGATGQAGVNMEQVFVSPALAWRLGEHTSFGVALNLAHQRFRANGIGLFGAFSSEPTKVSNNGHDTSNGAGVRIGWQGRIGERLDIGASWQSVTWMSEFDEYRGLFADQGDFDIPENYVVGIAFHASDALTLALDWQRILYSDITAVGNSAATLFNGTQQLGVDDGPGFGWKDIDVWKLGVVFRASPTLTLRAGYSRNDQPIPSEETFFNILAPGVIEQHASAGATWQLDDNNALTFAYTHAFGETVEGKQSIPPGMPPGFGGGEADIYLKEDIFGFSWNLKF